MSTYKLIQVTIIFACIVVLGCDKAKTSKVATSDTIAKNQIRVLNMSDTIMENSIVNDTTEKLYASAESSYIQNNDNAFELPLGDSRILHKVEGLDSINTFEMDYDGIELDEQTRMKLDSVVNIFDETKISFHDIIGSSDTRTEGTVKYHVNDSVIQSIRSTKHIYNNDNLIVMEMLEDGHYYRAVYLLSIKNDIVIDSIKIYYDETRESGFTYGRRFYIDVDFIISTRDYAFTESPFLQGALVQYQVNPQGKFIKHK